MANLPVYLVIAIGLGIAVFLGLVVQLLLIRKSKGKTTFVKYRKPRAISLKRLYFPHGLRTDLSVRQSSDADNYETYSDYADSDSYQQKGKIYSARTESYVNLNSEFRSKNSLISKMLRYQEILLHAENEKEIDQLNDELFSKFASAHPWLIEQIPYRLGLIFNFHPNNPLSDVKGSLMTFTKEKNLLYIGYLKKPFSISLDIQDVEEEKKRFVKKSDFQNIFGENHLLQSNVPAAFLEIVKDTEVGIRLKEIISLIKRLTIDDEIIFAIIEDNAPVNSLIELILLMQTKSLKIEKFGSKTSLLRCYECGKLFDTTELKCKKCSAPRPTCVVCLLNIDPSEKEGIMRLPCCGVYAHIHHIEQWLEKNSKCPNCHQDLNRIFRKM
ncbi:MAG: RING finger domain-containing protein [Candidatus Heimdallarchaeaceae archaeon]